MTMIDEGDEATAGAKSPVTIIGIDAAADPKNVGLARGVVLEDRLRELEVGPTVRKLGELVERITAWITPRTVLAIDAPLGWPRALGAGLSGHCAGQQLVAPAHELFRRFTDREVYRRWRVTPLDVGADRIARTALAALELLAAVRSRLACTIPLLWSPDVTGVGAIEVYPAATLVARGVSRFGYKKEETLRRTLLAALAPDLGVSLEGPAAQAMLAREHSLDAAICVLAGVDFLGGRAPGPADGFREVARVEGWIWVRDP